MNTDLTTGWLLTDSGYTRKTESGETVLISGKDDIWIVAYGNTAHPAKDKEDAFRYGNELCERHPGPRGEDGEPDIPEGWLPMSEGVFAKDSVIVSRNAEAWIVVKVSEAVMKTSRKDAFDLGEAFLSCRTEVQTLKATSTKALDGMVNEALKEGWKLDVFFQDETGGYCQRMVKNG